MKLTVLGAFGPYPPAGGACSGYLLEEEGYRLLLDCGNGVLSRLQSFCDFESIDGVILSHLHADHISDLMIMRYGLQVALGEGRRSEPLPLWAPAEPADDYARLPYKDAYRVEKIDSGSRVAAGPFTVTFQRGVHAVVSLAMKIESPSGCLVYSGDTEIYPALARFAGGADLFLCEANYMQAHIESGLANHMSATQAAETAAAAGVAKLVLTHHHPARDPALARSEAEKVFPGVISAVEGETYPVQSYR